MTGLLLIRTLSRKPVIRSLSIIFYGIGPACGPMVAIRPHLTMLRLRPMRPGKEATQARFARLGGLPGELDEHMLPRPALNWRRK